MTGLARIDRFWRWNARYIERPVLGLVASQRLLRIAFRSVALMSTGAPRGTKRWLDPDDGSLWLTPTGVASDAPVLFYVHGGGFTIGAPETHAGFVAHLAAALGARAVLPRYRLAPEHPFPAAPQDVRTSWQTVSARHGTPVALCGDSAGGCLALLLAMALRDDGAPLPRALALIAPVADLSGDLPAEIRACPEEHLLAPRWVGRIGPAYLRGADPTRADISPLQGNLAGLPPTLIQAAEGEVLATHARRLADAMDDATLDLRPGLHHVWHLHAGRSPAADTAVRTIADFIKGAVG